MGAKADDVDLSHNGRKIARKSGESKRGPGSRSVSKNFLNLRDGWNIARKHELWKDPINMTALVAIYDLKPRIAIFRL
jgi:hypothetical protein